MWALALGLGDEQRACLAMVAIQFLYAGMALLSKLALNKGMNQLVFVFYRQAIATIALAPFAYTLERTKAPPFSRTIFCKIFLLSLCGVTLSMDLYYTALRYTSATFASATANMLPVITFVAAIFLRMETIDLKTLHGRSKILGIVVCVGGAIVLCLYKGPAIKFLYLHGLLPPAMGSMDLSHVKGGQKPDLLKGSLLMLTAYTIWSLWLIIQAKLVKVYPAKLRLTTLQCFLSTLESAVIALTFNRKPCSWRLDWDVQLLSVTYCGVFVSGISYGLQIWCLEKKGPVYTATFYPLSLLITALFSTLLWSEYIHYGSVLGGLLIVVGLYCVLWGKKKEAISKEEKLVGDFDIA